MADKTASKSVRSPNDPYSVKSSHDSPAVELESVLEIAGDVLLVLDDVVDAEDWLESDEVEVISSEDDDDDDDVSSGGPYPP